MVGVEGLEPPRSDPQDPKSCAAANYAIRPTVVPGAGLEPARPYGQEILSLLRLPLRHPGNKNLSYHRLIYILFE
jgi:hypothetical protein